MTTEMEVKGDGSRKDESEADKMWRLVRKLCCVGVVKTTGEVASETYRDKQVNASLTAELPFNEHSNPGL
jgi:hypothetical protein